MKRVMETTQFTIHDLYNLTSKAKLYVSFLTLETKKSYTKA